MAAKKISQREARRLRLQVRSQSNSIADLERIIRLYRFSGHGGEGVQIYDLEGANNSLLWALQTAQALDHTVVARQNGNKVTFRALPLKFSPVRP